MQWSSRSKSLDELWPPTKPWRWWFAWRPITHRGRSFWLEWVPRRYVRQILFLTPSYRVEYAWPEHSIAGNVLGAVAGGKHGPHRNTKETSLAA